MRKAMQGDVSLGEFQKENTEESRWSPTESSCVATHLNVAGVSKATCLEKAAFLLSRGLLGRFSLALYTGAIRFLQCSRTCVFANAV